MLPPSLLVFYTLFLTQLMNYIVFKSNFVFSASLSVLMLGFQYNVPFLGLVWGKNGKLLCYLLKHEYRDCFSVFLRFFCFASSLCNQKLNFGQLCCFYQQCSVSDIWTKFRGKNTCKALSFFCCFSFFFSLISDCSLTRLPTQEIHLLLLRKSQPRSFFNDISNTPDRISKIFSSITLRICRSPFQKSYPILTKKKYQKNSKIVLGYMIIFFYFIFVAPPRGRKGMHLLGLQSNTIKQSISSQFHHTSFLSSQARTRVLSQSKWQVVVAWQ